MSRLEGTVYGLFIVIFGLIIWPQNLPFEFSVPRLHLLLGFVITSPLFRMLSYPELKITDLPRIFWSQPLYIKLLPLLATIFILVTLNSPLKGQAWFGGEGNQTGTYLYLLLLPLFWIFSTAKANYDGWIYSLIVIIAILTVVEYLGFRPLRPLTDIYQVLETSFPAATIGHRGQLAGFLLPLGGFLIYQSQKEKYNSLYLSLVFLFSVALGCTTNSAALLAIFGALCLWSLANIKFKPNGLILLLIFLIGYLAHFPLSSFSHYLAKRGIVKEEATSKNIGDTFTLKTRVYLWEAGYNMFKSRPIVGWGPQTYSLSWFRYLTPQDADKLVKLELGINSTDKYHRIDDVVVFGTDKTRLNNMRIKYFSAHNGYIDYLYAYGIFGILTTALIIYSLNKSLLPQKRLAILIFGLPYAIYLLAWFVTVPAIGIAVILLGYLISQNKSPQKEFLHEKQDTRLYSH